MSKRVRVPVRVIRPPGRPPVVADPAPRPVASPVEPLEAVVPPVPASLTAAELVAQNRALREQIASLEEEMARLQAALDEQRGQAEQAQSQAEEQQEQVEQAQAEAEDWRERALRLQAEMDNYRKRQRRLAQDEIAAEREHLLRAFLQVVDNLERALAAPADDIDGLRRGIELTHRAALQLLEQAGVEPIPAENQPFDPRWHEAVSTVSGEAADAEPDTIVQVLQPGYRLGETLLRPAQVIVAV